KTKIKTSFINAKNRLILLDYDGTLVPYSDYLEKAVPDKNLIKLLKRISSCSNTLVFIISDRDRITLDKWFTESSLGLIAEHGALIKMPNQDKWKFSKSIDISWKEKILTILQHHQDRVPGSFIEEKEYSISWHYKTAEGDKDLAQTRAKELFDNLIRFTSNIDIQILQGNNVIEVRNKDINKGTAALTVVSLPFHDFILAIGDDVTDEDMFKVLPVNSFSIVVGYRKSAAKYFVNNHHSVLKLLKELDVE
ncbi:MAG: trehalose-phosphatase, partial [Spirochaetes bacterium]|nr:trehalose-phosphatase [Spirochaetota bacterium]